MKQRSILLPREHGSWGMLGFPFFSAAILARSWSWLLIPAALAGLGVFLLREPLIVLLRQRYVWRDRRPETAAAQRTVAWFAPVVGASGLVLLAYLPAAWIAALGGLGAVLMAAYLYGSLHGMQRSTLLQVAGSIGLTASAALAWLAAGRNPDQTLAWLVVVQWLHSVGAVTTVHARLEAIQARRSKKALTRRQTAAAWVFQLVQLAAAGWAWLDSPWLAAALGIGALVHVADLLRLRDESFLATPLVRVGFRELALSLAVSVLAIVGLWAAGVG